jgi:HSP20 family molecular chaperone IbpA
MAEATYDVKKDEAQTPDRVERTHTRRVFRPRVDIWEDEDAVTVTADMPGVGEEGVEITLEQDLLTIRGAAKHDQPADHTLAYGEYEVGHYERSFTVTEQIDRDKVEATMKDGVLTLTLPKVKPEPPKKIQVKAG